jgi:hypothetical protein
MQQRAQTEESLDAAAAEILARNDVRAPLSSTTVSRSLPHQSGDLNGSSVGRARSGASCTGSSNDESAGYIGELIGDANIGMSCAGMGINDDNIMTPVEASRYYRVDLDQLCTACRLAFPSPAAKCTHDQWRHHIDHSTTVLTIVTGQSYCVECNIDEGTTRARTHFRDGHHLNVPKSKPGPQKGSGKIATTKWPPNDDYREFRGWRYASYFSDSKKAYMQILQMREDVRAFSYLRMKRDVFLLFLFFYSL